MPGTERAGRTAGRCPVHPGNPAPYACARCGRALCLTCATPVRGEILGPECLSAVLGPETAPDGDGPRRAARPLALVAAALGFLVALGGTVLPWSAPDFSHYTGAFGGWGFSPLAWSCVALAGAAAGLLLCVVLLVRPERTWTRAALAALGVAALLCVAGAVLFTIWPPFATRPWLGPWVTLGGAGLALVATALLAVSRRRARAARQVAAPGGDGSVS